MISSAGRDTRAMTALLALLSCAAWRPGLAQEARQDTRQAEPEAQFAEADAVYDASEEDSGSGTDIISADTFSVIIDTRLVLVDGANSWIDGGFGKTRFDGTDDADYQFNAYPVEASLIWQPRFTSTIMGNVSAAYQQGHDRDEKFDVMEGYLTFIPPRRGNTNFSLKAGYYWPEISLEHATGGAWSTVYTITPSAINSWVGEEVKVIGAEATLYQTIGKVDLSATAGVFGFNDTSGTLLSFRGWALHDIKSTLFGQFKLPPLNPFMTGAQEPVTRSVLEIDDKPGFYGRLEVRPSSRVVLNAFYYDNRGVPEKFTESLQWGWRTRFWNLGAVVDLGPSTRLLAQGMTGTTQMGFIPRNATRYWVDTRYSSAYALLTHRFGEIAVSGRAELFKTRERGSRMVPADENEDGWAATLAGRMPIDRLFTLFVEALHIESERGARATRLGIPAKETQNMLQAALRFRW